MSAKIAPIPEERVFSVEEKEAFDMEESTPTETIETPRRLLICNFIKKNIIGIIISFLVITLAGIFKYLNATLWKESDKWQYGKDIYCEDEQSYTLLCLDSIFHAHCHLSDSCNPLIEYQCPMPVCYNGTQCVLGKNCLTIRSPPTRKNYTISALTTIFLTVIVRYWLSVNPFRQYKNDILAVSAGWFLEIWVCSVSIGNLGDLVAPDGFVTNLFVAVSTCVAVEKIFSSFEKKLNAPRKPADRLSASRSSMIEHSLSTLATNTIHQRSFGKIVRSKITTRHILTVVAGIIAMVLERNVEEVPYWIFDFGSFLMFHTIGRIFEKIFYDLWLKEEARFDILLNAFRSPSSTLQTIEPALSFKLRLMRIFVKFTNATGAILNGLLLTIDSSITPSIIGMIAGILNSRVKRSFEHFLNNFSQPVCHDSTLKKRCKIVGRTLGIIGVIIIVSTGEDTYRFFAGTRIFHLTAIASLPVSWIIFKKLEADTQNKCLRRLAFSVYHGDVTTFIVTYALRHIPLENFQELGNLNSPTISPFVSAGIIVHACAMAQFLHRGMVMSSIFKDKLAVGLYHPPVAGAVLSWYLGISKTNPPSTSREIPLSELLWPPIKSP
jgi:hypothetical protein